MYRPPQFDLPDIADIHGIIRANGFAVLVSQAGNGIEATHLPLRLVSDAGNGVLWGHFSKANDHWRAFDGAVEALAIFQGAHTYISPDWYETEKSVPTWNYDAVHAYGKPLIMEEPDAIIARLSDLTAQYEEDRATPWRVDDLPEDFVRGQLKGIVAFDMPIDRLEGKRKMSQNRKPEDVKGAVAGLRATGRAGDAQVADLTEAANKDRLES